MTKDMIMTAIADHQIEMDSLKKDLQNITSEVARNAIQQRLSFLEDNQYRYKMEAKAMGY